MKKFLIFLGIGATVAAGVIGYTYWWAYRDFDKQD